MDSIKVSCQFLKDKASYVLFEKKKKKKLFYLKNWRRISLLNVGYKIASKTLALRLNKVHQRFAKTLGLSKLIFVSLCVHTPPHYIAH